MYGQLSVFAKYLNTLIYFVYRFYLDRLLSEIIDQKFGKRKNDVFSNPNEYKMKSMRNPNGKE